MIDRSLIHALPLSFLIIQQIQIGQASICERRDLRLFLCRAQR